MTVQLTSPCMGKITADKATLNMLASIFYRTADEYEKEGFPTCGDAIRRDANIIYDALDAKGFYDDIRRANK